MKLQGISNKGFQRLSKVVCAQADEATMQDFANSLSNFGLAGQQPSSYEFREFGKNLNEWVVIDGPDINMQGASHLEISNHEAVWEELHNYPDDYETYLAGRRLVRVFNEDGSFTGAGQALEEIMQSLANYPVLNEEDFMRREHEATISNIEWEGRGLVDYDKAPDDWAEQVHKWLWYNNQEALEPDSYSGEGYPSEDDIRAAVEALGWLEDEEEF